MSLACPVCQEHGELVLGAAREVTVGTVALLLERHPAVACPSRHGAAPPEAVEAAMAATDAAVPRARKRLLGGERCGRCGAQLRMPARRTRRTVTVEDTDELPVLTLHVDLPASRCPECGVDQLPTRSQEDLVVGVPAVFATGSQPDGDR